MSHTAPESDVNTQLDILTKQRTAEAESGGGVVLHQLVSGRSNNLGADDVRVTCPLFQAEYGGSTPTSALQLRFSKTDIRRARKINRAWHSRLPEITNWQGCLAYSAECGNVVYAVAIWGRPVSRQLNGLRWIELRRMAVADDAPKNTATRMLGWMLRELKKSGEWEKAISYQDTGCHKGTIYKASGWKPGRVQPAGASGWDKGTRGMKRNTQQTAAEKVRWEYALVESANGRDQRPGDQKL